MNLQHISTYISVIVGSIIAFSATPALANFSFNGGHPLVDPGGTCESLLDPNPPKLITCTTGDRTVITTGGTGKFLAVKTFRDVTGVGVSGGSNDVFPGEINAGEFIELTSGVGGIDLSFLFTPNSGDAVREAVTITTNLPQIFGTLIVNNDNTATWNWFGVGSYTVNATSPSTVNGAGQYRISYPFASPDFYDATITKLRLTALPQPGVPANSPGNSDFALVGASGGYCDCYPALCKCGVDSIKHYDGIYGLGWQDRAKSLLKVPGSVTLAVPEPATIAGLGLVGGSLLVSRRRKVSKD